MRLLALSVALLALLPCIASASGASSASAASDPPRACDDADSSPLLKGSQCMTVTKPLHHAQPEGPTVQLFVRRFPVAAGTARRGEVWLLSGGPGEAGASLYPFLSTYRSAFPGYDLVIPDHRGTGRSERLCPVQEAPSSEGGTTLAGAEWGPCIGALYANQPRTKAFSVTEAAHDVAWLLDRHRGQGEVLVYGVSYGTQLALRTLQVAQPRIDALILDGLVPPENTQRWDLSRRTALVDDVGRQVLGEEGVATYRRVLAAPADAAWRSQVAGGDLRRLLGTLLNFPELRARIPTIVKDLDAGDTTSLQRATEDLGPVLQGLVHGVDDGPALPLVMLIAASENNARPGLTRATVDAEAKDALFISPIPGLLVDSPVPTYERDAWFGRTPSTLPRPLVVHGTWDPNTAYEGALEHVALLSKAGPVTVQSVEEGAHLLPYVAPTCFVAAVGNFIHGRTVPTTCREPTRR